MPNEGKERTRRSSRSRRGTRDIVKEATATGKKRPMTAKHFPSPRYRAANDDPDSLRFSLQNEIETLFPEGASTTTASVRVSKHGLE